MLGPHARRHLATGLAIATALAATYAACFALDRWAARTFGWPLLASMLVAVIDVAVFVVALCAAPAISRGLQRLLKAD